MFQRLKLHENIIGVCARVLTSDFFNDAEELLLGLTSLFNQLSREDDEVRFAIPFVEHFTFGQIERFEELSGARIGRYFFSSYGLHDGTVFDDIAPFIKPYVTKS